MARLVRLTGGLYSLVMDEAEVNAVRTVLYEWVQDRTRIPEVAQTSTAARASDLLVALHPRER